MALLTLQQAKQFAGIAGNDTTRDASLSEMISEAIDAVKRHCNNGEIEQTEYTVVLDAPPYTSLILPYAPVQIEDFQLWRNEAANGNPAEFPSNSLLVMYTDYVLDPSINNVTSSESGIVRSLAGIWGYARERPVYSLTSKLLPLRGAIKVTYTAGYSPVPGALRGAVNLIVRKLFNMRKLGVPVTSESLNGYSYSAQGSATADGILKGDPTIRDMLKTFTRPQVGTYN